MAIIRNARHSKAIWKGVYSAWKKAFEENETIVDNSTDKIDSSNPTVLERLSLDNETVVDKE